MKDEKTTREHLLEQLAEVRERLAQLEGNEVPIEDVLRSPAGKEVFFRFLVDNTLDMITVVDTEGRVLYNSPSLYNYLGYDAGELNGCSAFDYIHPEDLGEVSAIFDRGVQAPGSTEWARFRFRHKNGSWRHLEAMGKNLLEDPEVRGIVITSRDITEQVLMQEGIKRSEEYFRVVLENAMDIIMIIDPMGVIKYINRAASVLLGRDPEELIGRSGLDLVHPEELAWAAQEIEAAARDSDYSPLQEVRIQHKDGSWRYMEGIGKNFLDHPAVRGIVLSFRDITDRKRAEEELKDSEGLHKGLVSISPDAVTISDLEGNVTYVSSQTLKLHGYDNEEEVLGKSAMMFIAPEEHERAANNMQMTLKEGALKNAEYVFLRKDGTRFIAELNAILIKDTQGNPKNLVAFTRDITERKRMEKELKDRNEELEAFAHTISHDLLTPVAIVEGYAKAALEADAEGRSDAERECLEAIARGTQRMSTLINSLLQYAQAGHMDPEVHAVDPEEILVEVLMDLEEKIRDRDIKVEVQDGLPLVLVDAVKLRQVFTNLIGNAIKHMGDNHRPKIEVGASASSPTATFFIHDNGIGIPSDLQARIYEPFRHFTLTGSPGLGIGLSTVKRAVTAWGGKTWVESTPGEGATFYFTAPMAY